MAGMAAPTEYILETQRLWLRKFCHRDLNDFARLVGDPQVMRFIGPCLTSLDDAAKYLEEPLADYRRHGFGRWAVVLKDSQLLIGFSGLKRLQELDGVDLGFGLMPEYWGRGLATEAGQAIMAYGFDTLELNRIMGLVDPPNARSIRVLEKLHFTFEKSIDFRGQPTLLYAAHKQRTGE